MQANTSAAMPDSFGRYVFTPRNYERSLAVYLQGWNRDGTPKPFARVNTFGAPGVGKTEMHGHLAKRWLRRVVTLHLSQKNPQDLQGIPVFLPNQEVRWFVSSYFPQQQINEKVAAGTTQTFNPNFVHAQHAIVRIVDEQDGRLVGLFGDGQRYDIGLEDLNEIGAAVEVKNVKSEILVDLSKAPKGRTYRVTLEDACLMFLDDLTAAAKSVLKAGLQLINDYRVGEYDVPLSCPLAAASNHEGHSSYIEVLSAAVANRMIHIHLKADIEDSINYWTRTGAHPLLISFMYWQMQELRGDEMLSFFDRASMKLGQLGYRSPRSWERMGEQLQSCLDADAELKASPDYDPARDMTSTESMVVGAVGESGGKIFTTYLSVYAKIPSGADILSGKLKSLDPQYKDDPGYQAGVATAIAGAVGNLYRKVYKPGQPMQKQDRVWQEAVKNYCTFAEKNLRREVTCLLGHLVLTHQKISMESFRSIPPVPEVDSFLKQYLPLLRRVVRGKVTA